MFKILKGLLFAFKNNPIVPKLKIVLKTSRMLRTNLIALLTKLGIWNKYTRAPPPFFKSFGTLYSYLFRIWMLFNILMVLYFVGTIGPIDSVYHLYNSIKNMFNSFNDFYSKMSQSFIDYLKHIFGDAPKPPKPDLPKLTPRPKTSSIYEYINKVSGKNDSFFSLRRLYALKESFNNATGYYTSWSDAVFSLETVKNISYFLMFGIFVYFVYINYENIAGLITTIAREVYN